MSKVDEFDKWFKSTYPEYCCGEAVIEPYYSIASYAWECAEQKQEKIITKLEKENAELRNNGFTVSAMTEQQLKVALEKGEQLEKENTELKDKLDNWVKCAELRLANWQKYEKENAELKRNKKTVVHLAECLEEKQKDQLAQAKEIIKELVRVEYADFTNGDYSNELSKVLEQAEQFLNSEVEK